MGRHATIDFETRSLHSVSDLGAYRYAEDPSTTALCLAYNLPGMGDDDYRLWHRAHPNVGIDESPEPTDLLDWIEDGGLVEAHNMQFEWAIWKYVIARERPHWPRLRMDRVRCSAAKAAAFALPRSLEKLALVLRSPIQKDMEGNALMRKITRPRRPTKKNPSIWHDVKEDFERLWQYCGTDVRTEKWCSAQLRDLCPSEQEVWQLDLLMNDRGIHIDRRMVEAALALVDELTRELTTELLELNGGAFETATQRQRLRAWCEQQGVFLPDTQGATVDAFLLRDDLDPRVQRVLWICRALGRSSTAKYEAARLTMCSDDRVRGTLLYHGAGTGRWSGALIQPHNFPRGAVKDMDGVCSDIVVGSREWIEFLHGDLMETLSHACRGMVSAPSGKDLVVADYSAIEARVVFWLADEQAALRVFERGECIYCDMAQDIYKRPINKKDHPTERQLGKQSILGLGYQMGPPKFLDTCAKYGIILSLEFSETVVGAYRSKYRRVRQMWYDQEEAAIEAVKRPGFTVRCGKVEWRVVGRFLHCKLPSGRLLSYCDPVVSKARTPWGDLKDQLSYMGTDPITKQWVRITTYGGMLVENITQATARDLMAEAKLRAEATGVYEVAFSVHDEIVAYVDEGRGSVREFEHLMSVLPEWANGCPVTAEGWRGKRWRK